MFTNAHKAYRYILCGDSDNRTNLLVREIFEPEQNDRSVENAQLADALAEQLGVDPTPLYFGLLSGATLGGNITPIGASANIATIGILQKEGYKVKTSDFLKIGVPFTLTAVIMGYLFIWFVWGGI